MLVLALDVTKKNLKLKSNKLAQINDAHTLLHVYLLWTNKQNEINKKKINHKQTQNPKFMKSNFMICIETMHVDDGGDQENVSIAQPFNSILCFLVIIYYVHIISCLENDISSFHIYFYFFSLFYLYVNLLLGS